MPGRPVRGLGGKVGGVEQFYGARVSEWGCRGDDDRGGCAMSIGGGGRGFGLQRGWGARVGMWEGRGTASGRRRERGAV